MAQTKLEPASDKSLLAQTSQTEFLGTVYPESLTIDIHNHTGRESWQPGDPIREIPRQHWDDPSVVNARVREPVNAPGLDPLVFKQQAYDEVVGSRGISGAFTTPVQNFEGIVGSTLPPDPNGWVGPNHVVETTNGSSGTRVRIWEKATGTQVADFSLAPTLQGPSACSSGLGDPVVLFDELAQRWIITEFSPQAGRSMCFYISATDDPTNTSPGNWNRYAFQSAAFPDYPKYGVWSDGYYVTANESSASGQRPVYAMDRTKMLAGQPAGWVRVNVPNLAGFGFQLLQPAHFTGFNPPPANAPGIFMRHRDDEAHNSGSNNPNEDYLELWQLAMNWAPATPVGTLTPVHRIAVAEFNSRINGLTAFSAFPQPNGQKLDPLREPVMNVLMYRNFGSHESLVGTLTTNTQTDPNLRGAVRWFELRRTSGTAATSWVLHDEGTFAPADADGNIHRWMGAIGIDDSGNIALGYSVVRQTPGVFPGLRYAGRLASDPPGVLTTGEGIIANGTRSQSNERWGDYHSMAIDPVDGCTFWFVGEYMGAAGGSNNTRVASFRHEECGDPTFLLNVDISSAAVCAATPGTLPITANVASANEYAGTVSLSFNPALPAGISGAFSPGSVAIPPDASVLANLDIASPAPGQYTLTVQASDGNIVKTHDIALSVSTQAPSAPALLSPANNALGLPPLPVLSWQPSTQGEDYLVEVATDSGFTNIVFSGSVIGGTSIAVSPALQAGTNYFWRVRSANECGNGGFSETFRFKTAPAPGQCDTDEGQSTHQVYAFDVEGTTTGWSTTGGTGSQTWTTSTARPFSGSRSWHAQNITSASDQHLTSPVISLPANETPVTLMFQNWRNIENNGTTACYDGGVLEVSVAGGAFTQLDAEIMNDPYRGPISDSYSNPLAGKRAWCEPSSGRSYANTMVDLSNFAGSDVRLRWRLGTDSSQGREGWYVDDISVQSCAQPQSLPDEIFEDGFE